MIIRRLLRLSIRFGINAAKTLHSILAKRHEEEDNTKKEKSRIWPKAINRISGKAWSSKSIKLESRATIALNQPFGRQ